MTKTLPIKTSERLLLSSRAEREALLSAPDVFENKNSKVVRGIPRPRRALLRMTITVSPAIEPSPAAAKATELRLPECRSADRDSRFAVPLLALQWSERNPNLEWRASEPVHFAGRRPNSSLLPHRLRPRSNAPWPAWPGSAPEQAIRPLRETGREEKKKKRSADRSASVKRGGARYPDSAPENV